MHVDVATTRQPDRRETASSATQFDTQPVSGMAFDALLLSLRVSHGAKALRHNRARETQVFEATPTDPRQHRLETMENQGRRGDVKADAGPLQRYRADARFAGGQRQGHGASGLQAERGDPAPVSQSERPHTQSSLSPPSSMRDFANQSAALSNSDPTRDREGAGSGRPRNAGQNPLPPGRGSVEGAGQSSATPAPVRAASPRAADQGESIARQIGKLLSAPRGAESNGAKAPASPTAGPGYHSEPSRDRERAGSGGPRNAGQNQLPHGRGSVEDAGKSNTTAKPDFDRIIRSIRLQVGKQQSTARMQLHPPHLGRMRVEAHLDGDRLALSIRTQSTQARDLIRQRLGDLQLALQRHGIQMERVEIHDSLTGSSNGDVRQDANYLGGEPDRLWDRSSNLSDGGPSPDRKGAGSPTRGLLRDGSMSSDEPTNAAGEVMSELKLDVRI